MNTELIEKEQRAKELLRLMSKREPLYVCYSGGKDSDVIRILSELSGADYELHHNLTTVDAPETVYYVRKYVKPENIHRPERSMWQLIVDKRIPPTRIARYCCAELKERGGEFRKKVTGVRWAESRRRKDNQGLFTIIGKSKTVQKMGEESGVNFYVNAQGGVVLNQDNAENRQFVENCYRTTSTLINPIIDWTDAEVWEFLKYYGCDSNPLYSQGGKRVGCIGCPLAGYERQKADLAKYPAYRANYVKAFDRMCKAREASGKANRGAWCDGEHVMRWWVGDDPMQITIDDWMKFREEEQETMREYVW